MDRRGALPLVDSSTLITQSYGYRAVLAEVIVIAIVVIVRGHPANPNAGRVLTCEDPH